MSQDDSPRRVSSRREWRSTETHSVQQRRHGHDAQTTHIDRGLMAAVLLSGCDGIKERGHSELPPIPQTPPKGDRVLGFKLLGTDIPERLV
jgi:hypothetical protein